MNYYKLNDFKMIKITVCKIGKIIIGSIERGLIEKKITALSHCLGDQKKTIGKKCKYLFQSGLK